MDQLFLLYYFVALAVGLFSLGCFFTILKNNKNEIFKISLICYGLFLLLILSTAAKMYVDITPVQNKVLVSNILFSAQFFGLIFSMYTVTFLINKIHIVPFAKRVNSVLFVAAAAFWIFCVVRDTGVINAAAMPFVELLDDELYSGLLCIYNIIVFLLYRKNIESKKLYRVLRVTLFIFLLFIPGFVFDELVSPGRLMIFTPFFFMFISIFAIHSFFKVDESIQTEKYVIPEDIKKKLCITERESEVFNLLLKGYSYNKIATELVISISTVRAHVSSIYRKAGVNSRYELYNIINP